MKEEYEDKEKKFDLINKENEIYKSKMNQIQNKEREINKY